VEVESRAMSGTISGGYSNLERANHVQMCPTTNPGVSIIVLEKCLRAEQGECSGMLTRIPKPTMYQPEKNEMVLRAPLLR